MAIDSSQLSGILTRTQKSRENKNRKDTILREKYSQSKIQKQYSPKNIPLRNKSYINRR